MMRRPGKQEGCLATPFPMYDHGANPWFEGSRGDPAVILIRARSYSSSLSPTHNRRADISFARHTSARRTALLGHSMSYFDAPYV